jgi:hypothetical protein
VKTLVSDYQILSSRWSFGCTISLRHLDIKGDDSRPFVMHFLPYSIYRQRTVDLFGFSPGCCEIDAPLPQMAMND